MDGIPEDIIRRANEYQDIVDRDPKAYTAFDVAVFAMLSEREKCAKIAAAEADYAYETYEGARLCDFLSVSRHIEAQILMKPHQRDKMRGISYPSQAIRNQT